MNIVGAIVEAFGEYVRAGGREPKVLYLGSRKSGELDRETKRYLSTTPREQEASAMKGKREWMGMKVLTVTEEPDHIGFGA